MDENYDLVVNGAYYHGCFMETENFMVVPERPLYFMVVSYKKPYIISYGYWDTIMYCIEMLQEALYVHEKGITSYIMPKFCFC